MLESVTTYVKNRRTGLTKVVGYSGCFYLARRYISNRLEEVKDNLEQERVARENLKRRFQQTQEDVSYTVLQLIPTLSEQILEEMDVEGLTQELQNRSRARNATQQLSLSNHRQLSGVSSSLNLTQDHDANFEANSPVFSNASTTFSGGDHQEESTSPTTSVSQSWVASMGSGSPAPSIAASSDSVPAAAHLSESFMSATTNDSALTSESFLLDHLSMPQNILGDAAITESSDLRSKTELWKEVKILTFTRTLTTLYSTSLLCLLTTIQLTILARSKYVYAVVQQEHEERMRERVDSMLSLSKLLLGGTKGLDKLMSGDMDGLLQGDDGYEEAIDEISEEIESKYLTLSWWLLHVGWKDVSERVRRGVEEVFDGVSLKSKLAITDVHRLISDVRRRVEHEITFEGNERRINFLSTLLPPTPETIQHVLTQGGFTQPTYHETILTASPTSVSSSQISQLFNSSPDFGPSNIQNRDLNSYHQPIPLMQEAPFTALVEETKSVIMSSDFAHVLEVCLDRATDILFQGLEKNVYVTSDPTPGEELRIRLAGLLPGLARWSQLALNGLPNELVDNLLASKEVASLSAIVFSQFEDRFR